MASDEELLQKLPQAQSFLNSHFGKAPEIAIVLGSGLSAFAQELKNSKSIPSHELPGAVPSSVKGHKGELVMGELGKTKALAVAGRVHGFEGYSPTQVVHTLRALRMWGVKKFILTNAAGSTSKAYRPGNLVLLKDHINFTGRNPLTGLELFNGDRFPDMSDVYSIALRKKARVIAKNQKVAIKEGVYVKVNGPNYETAAEIRMFAKWGAQLVGMSTVWEAIALKQMGAELLGISCVTNFGTGVTKQPLDHQEVIETTKAVQKTFNRFVSALMQSL